MFKRYFVLTGLFLLTILSVSAAAQSPSPKTAFISTGSFYTEPTGIIKLVKAQKSLQTEFAVRIKALDDGKTKLQTMNAEIEQMQSLRKTASLSADGVMQLASKQAEIEKLQRQLQFQQSDLQAAIERRRESLFAPVMQDINKALDEFAKKNGFDAIFDIDKLAEAGALLFIRDGADVTKDFIGFYNARTVTPAAPK